MYKVRIETHLDSGYMTSQDRYLLTYLGALLSWLLYIRSGKAVSVKKV